LIIYASLSIPILYFAYKHGTRAILGWAYLLIICSLRVIGPALEINSIKNHKSSTGAIVISSIGLSPLLLGSIGVLHEA